MIHIDARLVKVEKVQAFLPFGIFSSGGSAAVPYYSGDRGVDPVDDRSVKIIEKVGLGPNFGHVIATKGRNLYNRPICKRSLPSVEMTQRRASFSSWPIIEPSPLFIFD